MAKPSTPVINVNNVYQYDVNKDILTTQQEIGSYDLNNTIKTSSMPRKREETDEILHDEQASVLAGAEKGAERTFKKSISTAIHIAPTAKVIGAINDANSIGQQAIKSNGAETVTEISGAIGQGSGLWAGAIIGAEAFPPSPPVGALIGGGLGAYVGGKKMKEWGKQLTGGDTPDLIVPPKSPPNNADIQPTITTNDNNQYALVLVEGKYHWYAIMDNSDLMLPNRFVGVMSGAKNAELTETYLKAAGYDKQIQERINQMAAQTTQSKYQENRESFMHAEIAQRNIYESSITHIKQGKAPDGSELGKIKSDSNSSSIWIHDSEHKRFVSVATAGHGKNTQSVEMYYDEKTGVHTGGKIYVPDGNGQHIITSFSIESLPDGSKQLHPDQNSALPPRKVSQHVENLSMAHTFAHGLPIHAVQKHGKLVDAYIAQAAFMKQIESGGASSDLKAAALGYFNEKAINNIAIGSAPTAQAYVSVNHTTIDTERQLG